MRLIEMRLARSCNTSGKIQNLAGPLINQEHSPVLKCRNWVM